MPSSKPLDVVGIGNALVDVITTQVDSFLEECSLTKGAMMLIDTERAVSLYAAMGPGVEMSGGSAANTMCGVASFGGRCAYIGKVSNDQLGEVFAHDLRATGVQFSGPSPATDIPTGRCLIVVTPDAQRTMSTYLGVSELLGPDDVDEAVVASAQVLYMEGYLWDRPEAMAAYRKAAAVAHRAGGLVSLSLSDSFCVDRHRDAFLDLVATEVDVLFANEAEVCALYGTEKVSEAYSKVAEHCDLAAITLGSKGSVVVERSGDVHEVVADPVPEVVDTTGAGDLYASGFLYGLTRGLPPAECGRLGSVAAAEVISHVGARPSANLARLAGLD